MAGTVAAAGFQLALFLGATSIALVGQDFAFPRLSWHCRGYAFEEMWSLRQDRFRPVEAVVASHILRHELRRVPAADGGRALTSQNFLLFQQWFVDAVRRATVPVFQCTRGGALLPGAEHVGAAEAIRRSPGAGKKVDLARGRSAAVDPAGLARCAGGLEARLNKLADRALSGLADDSDDGAHRALTDLARDGEAFAALSMTLYGELSRFLRDGGTREAAVPLLRRAAEEGRLLARGYGRLSRAAVRGG
jgi:hypothetical protein